MKKEEQYLETISRLESELNEAHERIALLAQEVVLLRSQDPKEREVSDLVRSWYQDLPN